MKIDKGYLNTNFNSVYYQNGHKSKRYRFVDYMW
jgi:hypothetical protein